MIPTFDVIVIGLGGMGSATVCELARRGLRVLGLEQFTSPHNRGSSHGGSRMIRQAYFEHPSYVPLVLRAYDLWRQLEQETGQSILHLTGGLMIGQTDSAIVQGSLRSAQIHGLAYEILDAATLRKRFPLFHPDANTVALYEPHAGFLDPELAISAYLHRAAQLGATLQFEAPVLNWTARTEGVEVITASGRYQAEKLVLTPGAWATQTLQLDLPLVVERQVLYWFHPAAAFELFHPDRLPVYAWETADGTQFYGFPAYGNYAEGVKVAFFRAKQPITKQPIAKKKVCTPNTLDRTIHADEIAGMKECLSQYIPALNGNLIKATTCMYTSTPDGHFVLGIHPHHPQVVIASPCSGHGFKFASVIGRTLSDLVIDPSAGGSLSLFHPSRFGNGMEFEP